MIDLPQHTRKEITPMLVRLLGANYIGIRLEDIDDTRYIVIDLSADQLPEQLMTYLHQTSLEMLSENEVIVEIETEPDVTVEDCLDMIDVWLADIRYTSTLIELGVPTVDKDMVCIEDTKEHPIKVSWKDEDSPESVIRMLMKWKDAIETSTPEDNMDMILDRFGLPYTVDAAGSYNIVINDKVIKGVKGLTFKPVSVDDINVLSINTEDMGILKSVCKRLSIEYSVTTQGIDFFIDKERGLRVKNVTLPTLAKALLECE